MSRPFYCSTEDVEREKQIAERFTAFMNRTASQFKWSFEPSGRGENFDFKLFRDGAPIAVVEIRSRFGNRHRFSHWHTALKKLNRCLNRAKELGLPLFMIYSWNEETFYVNAQKLVGLPTHRSGRYDRGDDMDVEDMILMPPSLFTQFA